MSTDPLALQIVIASTRPARKGPLVASWFLEQARKADGYQVELIDLAAVNLPMFDEPRHPRFRQYEHEHTRAWSAVVDRADCFVFVVPEYNFSAPPSLLNALDYLSQEWAYKPAGFVSYGGVAGGTRSVQMLKQTVTALKMMPMFEGVIIPFFTQYENKETGVFDPGKTQADAAQVMLKELARWAGALKPLRRPGRG
ncbi:MAG TPA: NAD(P)H-dependent oxidoreductase [Gemmatimonadales bacterium]|nr:NAD(P)H-dependent oxidoreductase [Gemmatimonadales bacterium]